MEKQEKVLDASIIFKWFSDESDSGDAIKLKEEFISGESLLVIPILAIVEVMNALRYKEKDETKVKKANEFLQEFQLRVEPITKSLIDKCIENSFKYNITIYDSLYVSVAQLRGCSLITTDKELFKIPNVVPLSKV